MSTWNRSEGFTFGVLQSLVGWALELQKRHGGDVLPSLTFTARARSLLGLNVLSRDFFSLNSASSLDRTEFSIASKSSSRLYGRDGSLPRFISIRIRWGSFSCTKLMIRFSLVRLESSINRRLRTMVESSSMMALREFADSSLPWCGFGGAYSRSFLTNLFRRMAGEPNFWLSLVTIIG